MLASCSNLGLKAKKNINRAFTIASSLIFVIRVAQHGRGIWLCLYLSKCNIDGFSVLFLVAVSMLSLLLKEKRGILFITTHLGLGLQL